MANFFKDYQKEVRQRKAEEGARERAKACEEKARRDFIDGLTRGQKVAFSVLVHAGTDKPAEVRTLYFADKVSPSIVLLSENRAEAVKGIGQLFPVCGILEAVGA